MGRLVTHSTPDAATEPPRPSAKTQAQIDWAARATDHARLAAPLAAQTIPALLTLAGVRAGRRVLDLGCGAGFATGAVYAMGADVIGVDFSPAMIAEARAKFPKTPFRIGAAEALDDRPETYDAVLCNFAMAQFTDPARAFVEARRALKPGGRLVWSAWAATEDNPFMAAARAALRVSAEGVFRYAAEAAAEHATKAAGMTLIGAERASIALEAKADDAATLARMLDPAVDATAGSDATSLTAALKRFVKGGALEARGEATLYVAQKPGDAVSFDALAPSATLSDRRQGFSVVRRLLGGR